MALLLTGSPHSLCSPSHFFLCCDFGPITTVRMPSCSKERSQCYHQSGATTLKIRFQSTVCNSVLSPKRRALLYDSFIWSAGRTVLSTCKHGKGVSFILEYGLTPCNMNEQKKRKTTAFSSALRAGLLSRIEAITMTGLFISIIILSIASYKVEPDSAAIGNQKQRHERTAEFFCFFLSFFSVVFRVVPAQAHCWFASLV